MGKIFDFKKRSIRFKITSIYVFNIISVIALLLLIGSFYENLSNKNLLIHAYSEQNRTSSRLNSIMSESISGLLTVIYKNDMSNVSEIFANNENLFSAFDEFRNTAQKYNFYEDINFATENEGLIFSLRTNVVKCIEMNKTEDKKTVEEFYSNSVLSIIMKIDAFIEDSIYTNKIKSSELYAEINSFEKLALSILAGAVMLLLIANVLYGNYIRNVITKPVRLLEDRFNNIYDLTIKLDVIARDEIGHALLAYNIFIDKLRAIFSKMSTDSEQIEYSTKEISQSTTNLSDNAQNLAASAEEITSTIEEMTAGIEQISANATVQDEKLSLLISKIENLTAIIQATSSEVFESVRITELIHQQSQYGKDSLKTMNESLKKISESSKDISNSAVQINEISDRVNLLSLNAAIEAARAGEFGRGFAVVADEISKLADQTSFTIKNIEDLINRNNEEIMKGMKNLTDFIDIIGTIIDEADSIGSFIKKINTNMQKQLESNTMVSSEAGEVRVLSKEISSGTREQSYGMSEIVKSLSIANEMAQITASSADEINGSFQMHSDLSKSLNRMIEEFKL